MKKIILKILTAISLLLGCYILFINFFIYPCTTQGMSMYPTIAPNEIKLTNRWKVISGNHNINRGDIVVIEQPSVLYVEKERYNSNDVIAIYDEKINLNPFRVRLMKRVIGLEGDHIQINTDGQLFINGEIYYEDYIEDGYTNRQYVTGMEYMYVDVVIPSNTVYVLGDNRSKSIDSRSFGCIPLEKLYSVVMD